MVRPEAAFWRWVKTPEVKSYVAAFTDMRWRPWDDELFDGSYLTETTLNLPGPETANRGHDVPRLSAAAFAAIWLEDHLSDKPFTFQS